MKQLIVSAIKSELADPKIGLLNKYNGVLEY